MHIQFADIPVLNQDRAKKFYLESFNCRAITDQPIGQDGWRWIELKLTGAETALHFVRRQNDSLGDMPVLVLVEDEVEATIEALRSKGVRIASEPHKPAWQPARVVAEVIDSEGNRIMIGSK